MYLSRPITSAKTDKIFIRFGVNMPLDTTLHSYFLFYNFQYQHSAYVNFQARSGTTTT
jgi:hypothetical protein